MAFLKSKINWVIIILVLLLIISFTVNLQAKEEKEEVNNVWLSKTVHTFYSYLVPPIYTLDNVLAEQSLEETEFPLLSEQLHSANVTAGTMSNSVVSPQAETWRKISTTLSIAEDVASDGFSEYEETGKISKATRTELKKVEKLGMNIINVLQSELDLDTGIVTEKGIEELNKLTEGYNQQLHKE